MHARASAGDSEYFDAAMRAPLLKRIAEETGGRFFTPANAASLPEAISYSGRGVTVVEERDLWDMPILLIAAPRPDRRRVGLPPHAGAGVSDVGRRPAGRRVHARLYGRFCGRRCVARLCAAPAAAQDVHLLVITGVGGDEEHVDAVPQVGVGASSTRRRSTACPTPTITYLAREARAAIRRASSGRSTRENVTKAFADLAARAKPNDEVVRRC